MGLKELIYEPGSVKGEAVSKVESHTPKIEAPNKVKAGEIFKVKVWVGPHPNTVEHSIRWIELYFEEQNRPFNPVLIGRYEFTPVYSEPVVEAYLKISKPGRLIAIEYCNLHGLWESSKEIGVE
ncbi:class II SORL domain-containing protein [Thermosphaera chiliense]|mgnify:CR=1 FL=1|uniref:Class II SORL domain-containing protein n=1 Tax=Thermosphaera chiliense TaxID=3402707 RepID=A0A7M1UTQ0_9CREN|nr:class II SORL domain-containing protein [Thermosphaera aggregans]QOR95127.1 class II SORL domain-containing protein [Thermosphaera aggregans]